MTDSDPIVIVISGHPVPQGRPRMAVIAGHAMAYKPAKSRRWEQDARQVARQTMGSRKPLEGALRLVLFSNIVPAQSWPLWKREAAIRGQIRPTGKPDVSNLLKAAEDALNGVVWLDDAQVVSVEAIKAYTLAPSTVVQVWTLSTLSAQTAKKTDLA